MPKPILPILPFEKMSKKAGIKRISRDALEEMRDTVEELGSKMAEDAVRISVHAGRRTLKKRDITFIEH